MSDEEDEEDSVDGDLVPAFLTMGVTASVLRAYHRIARMLRKAWTDMRFADDPVEEVEVAAVRCQPERIEDLCKATKFSRQELKFMYQGFKQVRFVRWCTYLIKILSATILGEPTGFQYVRLCEYVIMSLAFGVCVSQHSTILGWYSMYLQA